MNLGSNVRCETLAESLDVSVFFSIQRVKESPVLKVPEIVGRIKRDNGFKVLCDLLGM